MLSDRYGIYLITILYLMDSDWVIVENGETWERSYQMSMVIFFGGLVMGFLMGWVAMVLLTMATERNQQAQLAEGLIFCQISPGQDRDRVGHLGE